MCLLEKHLIIKNTCVCWKNICSLKIHVHIINKCIFNKHMYFQWVHVFSVYYISTNTCILSEFSTDTMNVNSQ